MLIYSAARAVARAVLPHTPQPMRAQGRRRSSDRRRFQVIALMSARRLPAIARRTENLGNTPASPERRCTTSSVMQPVTLPPHLRGLPLSSIMAGPVTRDRRKRSIILRLSPPRPRRKTCIG